MGIDDWQVSWTVVLGRKKARVHSARNNHRRRGRKSVNQVRSFGTVAGITYRFT
jgi:hypothetical protein